MNKKKIVVIGGGHGQATICRGLKELDKVELTAIVTVADDGGSTGRLRKKFHIPAMGDIRNVMIAMSKSESLMRVLMEYRFEDPDGTEVDIAGHNLGNLILTALTQQSGNFLDAIQQVTEVLNVQGKIIPATTEVISLFARMEDGVVVKGEANIPTLDNHIIEVFYERNVQATPQAIDAIMKADVVIYGIGSVYTSILPNVIIPKVREALKNTKAKKIYICNAMSQPGETDGYCLEDHVQALFDHGAKVDVVIGTSDTIPQKILDTYEKNGSYPVYVSESNHSYRLIMESLLMFDNGLIRHNPKKIAEVIEREG
ncbi:MULTISPECIES: uridine diphosphate-N-acetylglucosamine-binding protein YvcK [Terrabacteria group]|uniref:gluconeogenesis factor YvcK family protein n=1 Tax=Bacillati TaxID=1783272 RepID=UPI001C6F15A5|nr:MULTISPECIES: uridine diphosphate-N-acetylglucosamine-binding protein YvcK [Terrabacteria group]MBW9212458.1 uridine diphosphate-N-acetylglucosamine-binding protein YvcK [Trueperella sp. zg.1013]